MNTLGKTWTEIMNQTLVIIYSTVDPVTLTNLRCLFHR
jgi:hypothetical protein